MSDSISSADLRCKICSEYFTDPRLLPCLHVYCKHCIDINSLNEGSFRCVVSTCKTTTTQDYISTLPKHLRIERQVNMLKLQQCSNEVVCGSCEDNTKAEAYCIDCDSPICSSCVTSHKKLKMLKNHSILSVDDPQFPDVPSKRPMCLNHPTMAVSNYCKSCRESVCGECLTDHKDHDWDCISNVVTEKKEELQRKIQQVKKKCDDSAAEIKTIDAKLDAVTEKSGQLGQRLQSVLEKLQEEANSNKKQLESQKENLLNIKNKAQLVINAHSSLPDDNIQILSFLHDASDDCCHRTELGIPNDFDFDVIRELTSMPDIHTAHEDIVKRIPRCQSAPVPRKSIKLTSSSLQSSDDSDTSDDSITDLDGISSIDGVT